MIRHFAPSPTRRTELHRQIAERCGVSERAAMLLVELDVFGEVRITDDEHLAAFAELSAKGLAALSDTPRACIHALPTFHVREVIERISSIMALEGELARRARSRLSPPPALPEDRPRNAPLSPRLERAIIDDALALIDATAALPAAGKARVYLRTGPRYVRVFWTYATRPDDDGWILHFVERATGRVYAAKSARQVGRFTGRVIAAFGGADA